MSRGPRDAWEEDDWDNNNNTSNSNNNANNTANPSSYNDGNSYYSVCYDLNISYSLLSSLFIIH